MNNTELFYSKQGKSYENDKIYNKYCNKKYSLLRNYVKGKILDAGCANGWFYKRHKHKNKVINQDFVERDVPNFVRSKITNLPFANNFFDTVICLDVLEHLDDKAHLKALDEIFRVGKRIIISTTFGSKFLRKTTNLIRSAIGVLDHELWCHYREYDEKEFTNLLKKYGKIINSFDVSLPFCFMPISDFAKEKKFIYTKMFIVDKNKK